MAAANYHESSSSSSSSSSRSRRCRYDVFLSFRGEETRKTFTGHLYMALKRARFDVFKDDSGLRVGEYISAKLLEAIDSSRISVVIFSADYAGSSWCLDELVKIMECKKNVQQMVYPVFYKAILSHVRKQSGSFKEAFDRYEDEKRFENKVLQWREALTEAGNLKGLHIEDHNNEAESVQNIVEEIQKHVSNIGCLHVAKYPVGLDSHVEALEYYLSRRRHSNDVCIIGICSMGGMGKTTIAKAFYNHLLNDFEYNGFLDVSESSKDGFLPLQNKLLSKTLESKKAGSIPDGTKAIEEKLNCTKVLIVVDNVDHQDQLDNLAIRREREQFASGSIIIITTRFADLLDSIKVDWIHRVERLNDEESLELFCWHAFSESCRKEDYVDLSNDIIKYCKGLPLALTVLGSLLIKKDACFWKDTLHKLKINPKDGIYKKLKISYDALDHTQKSIFLDVACFFIGMDKDCVHAILEACELHLESGITTLISRSLLTVGGYNNKLMMHDLLRDMGRKIVREESANKLGNYSRLWHEEDVLKVLSMRPKGTESIEGLILKLPASNKKHFSAKAFANIPYLRLLQLNYVKVTGSYDEFSKELRWLCWHGFPLECILDNLYLENLVHLDMRYSKLREFPKQFKVSGKLKVLDLSHSKSLRKTPDFSEILNIEKLGLKDCTRLIEVHPSIGNLQKLYNLDMTDCKELKSLPDSICKLKALKSLNLSGCSKFERLPNDMTDMEALVSLQADKTALKQVPVLKHVEDLSLQGCTGLRSRSFLYWLSARKSLSLVNFLGLTSLRRLTLKDCNLSDEVIPKDIWSLSSLVTLDLRGNNFRCLPPGISNLYMLKELWVDHCKSLISLVEIPESLIHLSAKDCPSLERFPNGSRFPLPRACMMTISKLEKFVASCLMNDAIPQYPQYVLVGHVEKIPSQFCHQSMSPRLSLTVLGYFEDAVLDVWLSHYHGGNERLYDLVLTRWGGLKLSEGDQLEIQIRPTLVSIHFSKLGVRLYDKSESGTGSIQLNGAIMPNSHSPGNSMIPICGGSPSNRCELYYLDGLDSRDEPGPPWFDIDVDIIRRKDDMVGASYKRPRYI